MNRSSSCARADRFARAVVGRGTTQGDCAEMQLLGSRNPTTQGRVAVGRTFQYLEFPTKQIETVLGPRETERSKDMRKNRKKKIKELEKVSEKYKETEEGKKSFGELENKLDKHEKEVQQKELKKLNRDKIDCTTGRVYTLSSRFDALYNRQMMDQAKDQYEVPSSVKSSEVSSGDEGPSMAQTKLDFSEET
ncbi:hypothetical protein NDU88_000684 [Pleurodeles waltl]|uniref:Uncharacterized protein n=1 Tax=Pleurodeles waltl TaxID=8319 RepID=A0AAV7MI89_PLEWA|nr:hypothetical protein NDU88_000684 [Pleurodeles waltl]